jgi:hypothetical protein
VKGNSGAENSNRDVGPYRELPATGFMIIVFKKRTPSQVSFHDMWDHKGIIIFIERNWPGTKEAYNFYFFTSFELHELTFI